MELILVSYYMDLLGRAVLVEYCAFEKHFHLPKILGFPHFDDKIEAFGADCLRVLNYNGNKPNM